MITYTEEHRAKLEAYLAIHKLPSGMGSYESACTVAAINLALSGKLTDDIPDCMSKVLGRVAISLQDVIPDAMRNSDRYKSLIPDMPGTGRLLEKERLAVLLDWMWGIVLPQLQPRADRGGFGEVWRTMCEEKTVAAARAAVKVSRGASGAVRLAIRATKLSEGATLAHAQCYDFDYDYAGNAANAAVAAVNSPFDAEASYAFHAASAANYAAIASDDPDFWIKVDPIGVLERMTYLEGKL